jgi:crotonobetainyl-CoA:carnitine CoA-transferase CaiB-like acyl-CoA transferase
MVLGHAIIVISGGMKMELTRFEKIGNDPIRMLSFSQHGALPHAGTFAAWNLGWEVIKIEPRGGESGRSVGATIEDESTGKKVTTFFAPHNVNVKSLTGDVKHPKFRTEVLEPLIRVSNAITWNQRAGFGDRMKLSYPHIKELNPHCVTGSITGWGEKPPYAERGAYAWLSAFASGKALLSGEPGEKPTRDAFPEDDYYTGVVLIAAVASLISEGRGGHIDGSLFASAIFKGTYNLTRAHRENRISYVRRQPGAGHLSVAAVRLYVCGDDKVLPVMPMNQGFWEKLCPVIGRPDLLEMQEYRTPEKRRENRDSLERILIDVFRTRPAPEWVDMLAEADVPCEMARKPEEVPDHPQVISENLFTSVQTAARPLFMPAPPLRINGARPDTGRVPDIGEDTDRILAELGHSEQAIARLHDEKVV